MRAILVVALFLLAGCSGGGAPLGVSVSDLPAGWVPLALDHPEASEMMTELSMKSNPGFADHNAAELGDINATRLYIGLYGPDAYADDGFISYSLTFRTINDANEFVEIDFFCEFDAFVYQQGTTVVVLDREGSGDVEAGFQEAKSNFEQRTGLTTICQ